MLHEFKKLFISGEFEILDRQIKKALQDNLRLSMDFSHGPNAQGKLFIKYMLMNSPSVYCNLNIDMLLFNYTIEEQSQLGVKPMPITAPFLNN